MNLKNFKHKPVLVGIPLIIAFILVVLSCGCTDISKVASCGNFNESCCENNVCNSSSFVCTGGKCMNCGISDEICCENEICNSPDLVCFNGSCRQCGIIDGPCCENNTCNADAVCVKNNCMNFKINISTDKGLYRSKEKANITFSIDSSGELKDATLNLHGIYARNKHYLSKTGTANLTAGENVQSIIYNLPSCTGCSGISPGTYMVQVDLVYNGTVISNSTKNVEIRQ